MQHGNGNRSGQGDEIGYEKGGKNEEGKGEEESFGIRHIKKKAG